MIYWLGWFFFFFQAEDGIRDLVRSRGLGDVYKRQIVGQAEGSMGGKQAQLYDWLYGAPPSAPSNVHNLSLIHI